MMFKIRCCMVLLQTCHLSSDGTFLSRQIIISGWPSYLYGSEGNTIEQIYKA